VAKDAIYPRLAKAVERRERTRLWVSDPWFTFVPMVLPKKYGDGRRLFAVTTINQRPRYWVVRVDSSCDSDSFGELTDEILTDLEETFGNGRCGYSGNNLFQSKRERRKSCDCDDCKEVPVAKWPMVDADGGCAWGRMKWPAGFITEDEGYLLAAAPKPEGSGHG